MTSYRLNVSRSENRDDCENSNGDNRSNGVTANDDTVPKINRRLPHTPMQLYCKFPNIKNAFLKQLKLSMFPEKFRTYLYCGHLKKLLKEVILHLPCILLGFL